MNISVAFFMGFVGGMHCIGMCGPIAAALTIGQKRSFTFGVTLYHLGRIFTYAVLGFLFAYIGSLLSSADLFLSAQKVLSVIAGLAMIAFALIIGGWAPDRFGKLSFISIPASALTAASRESSSMAWLVVGLVNGLLPCGLVYATLALAINAGTPVEGALLMAVFGIGTAPSLLGVSFLTKFISSASRTLLLKIAAVGLVLFGVFMVAKALFLMGDMPIKKHEKTLNQLSIDKIEQKVPQTPWDIHVNDDGTVDVFGLTVGASDFSDAKHTFNSEPKVALFTDPDGGKSLEAYFGKVVTGGITGKVIATMVMDDGWADRAIAEGVDQQPASNGSVQHFLTRKHYLDASQFPIASLTFIPSVSLDEQTIQSRFGTPYKIEQLDDDRLIYIYPNIGLKITLGEGKEILEYTRRSL